MEGMYNMRSPAVKRLMKEAQELREPTEQYYAQPLEDNLFEWHFTIRGPADSDFDGGLYHGRIVLPPEYPMKPPSILILTPNGRFEINKKICLSISGHHPESWQPSWSIRTALLAIIGFMPTHGAGAIGSLNYTKEERKVLALRSQDFNCSECGHIGGVLLPVTEASESTRQEARELASQIDFKDEKEKESAMKQTQQQGEATPSEPNSTETLEGASSSNATSTPQPNTIPNPMVPPSFGQFPLQNPFMTGFPLSAPNSSSSTSAHVPRFPPPFLGPMFPPFPQLGVPPMIPGMNLPPWPPGAGFPRPPFGTLNQPQNSAASPVSQPSILRGTTSSQSSGGATAQASASGTGTDLPQTSLSSSSSSMSSSAASSSAIPTQSSPVSVQSTNVTTTTETPSQPRQTASQSTSASVRQRTTTRPATNQRTSPQNTAVNNTQTRDRDSTAFLLFVGIVSLVIALLIVRRLYMIKIFNKYWF